MISGLLCLSVLVMSIVQAHATILPVMHDAVNTSAAIHHDGMADAMAPPWAHHHTGSPCKGHDGACGLDAAFANPETYEFLEAEGYKYTIRLPARCCSTGSGRLDLDLMISGPRVNPFHHPL